MDQPSFLASRSASLPSTTLEIRAPLQLQTFRVEPHNAPITPPMSPDCKVESLEDSTVVDKNTSVNGSCGQNFDETLISHSQPINGQHFEAMEVDTVQTSLPPRPPVRLLEDEEVRLEKPGTLRLTDFEVKGTLG